MFLSSVVNRIAQFCRNEQDVGNALKKVGLPREDVFITTKLWKNGRQNCMKSFKESLKKLQLDFVDLYLLHSPGRPVLEAYDACLELQKQGLIRSVGVSNFGVQHLEALAGAGRPTPAVNQIELHPFERKQPIVDYCRAHCIALTAYSPLARGQRFGEPVLNEMAARYNKTPAQLMIRWGLQLGYVSIPKSVRPDRIVFNSQVFDFQLSDDDMTLLNRQPQASTGWDPTVWQWEG